MARHTFLHDPSRGEDDMSYIVIIKFSPDGTKLMTGDQSSIKIWDVATGELYREINNRCCCEYAQFLTIKEELYIVAGVDICLKMWNVNTGSRVWSIALCDEVHINSEFLAMAVSPDQSLIATGFVETDDEGNGPWRLFLHNQGGEYINHIDVQVGDLVFTNDSSKIIAAVDNLVLYNAHDLSVLKTIAPDQGIMSLAVAKDGRIAAGTSEGFIFVWSPDGNEMLMRAKASNPCRSSLYLQRVSDLCFSPDGMHILFPNTQYCEDREAAHSIGENNQHYFGYICVCDAKSGELLHRIHMKFPMVRAVDCSKDYTIASGSFNRIQMFHDTSLEERRRERKTMMLSLRRANRRRRDRQGNQLPSVAGRKVYDASGVLKNVHDFL